MVEETKLDNQIDGWLSRSIVVLFDFDKKISWYRSYFKGYIIAECNVFHIQ